MAKILELVEQGSDLVICALPGLGKTTLIAEAAEKNVRFFDTDWSFWRRPDHKITRNFFHKNTPTVLVTNLVGEVRDWKVGVPIIFITVAEPESYHKRLDRDASDILVWNTPSTVRDWPHGYAELEADQWVIKLEDGQYIMDIEITSAEYSSWSEYVN